MTLGTCLARRADDACAQPSTLSSAISSASESEALSSVGAYQLEGKGIQLFEKIEGDYFTILGLPMLPLLAKLRELGAIDG